MKVFSYLIFLQILLNQVAVAGGTCSRDKAADVLEPSKVQEYLQDEQDEDQSARELNETAQEHTTANVSQAYLQDLGPGLSLTAGLPVMLPHLPPLALDQLHAASSVSHAAPTDPAPIVPVSGPDVVAAVPSQAGPAPSINCFLDVSSVGSAEARGF